MNKEIFKRVCICSTAYLPDIGGAEISVFEITNRISNVHFDLFTIAHTKNLAKQENIGNVSVYRIGYGKFGKLLFPIRAYFHIRKAHKKNPYNTVWGIMASYGGFTAFIFKILHPKTKFLLTLQEGDSLEHIKKRIRFFAPLYKQIFRKADQIQVISHFLAEFAKSQGYKKNISIIPNGVDASRYVDKNRDYSEVIKIITTSRLVEKNGIDTLILALYLLPKNIHLTIVGDGSERDMLETLVEANSLQDRVKFLGSVLPTEIPKLLSESHIFVRPSRSEGLGNSFLEAMASGVPIIGTEVGGIPDFLFDPDKNPDKNPTGLFAEVNSPKSIASAVLRLVEDSDIRNKIIKNAKSLVSEKYEWKKISKDIEKIL